MRSFVGLRGAVFAFVLTAGVFAFAAAAAAPIASVPDRTYVTNGAVESFARVGDKLYIGGGFSRVGPRTGPWAAVDASSGAVKPGLPEVAGGAGIVSATVGDGAGGWYVGGDFTHVGGPARSNLAHIRADGSVDPAVPQPNGPVRALAFAAGTLYVGGQFSSIGGTSRNALAAVDTAGNVTSWNAGANSSTPPAYVNALVVSGTTLYVGGNFTGIGGESAGNLAALSTTNASQIWTAQVLGYPWALALQGSTLYLTGALGQVGGMSRPNLAAVSTSDGSVLAWNPSVGGGGDSPELYALAASASAVYVGGRFVSLAGASRSDIGAVDPVSGTATSWNPGANGSVNSLVLTGSTLLVGGSFSTIGGMSRLSVAELGTGTGTPTGWAPQSTGQVNVLAPSGANVAVGGRFASLGAVERPNLAELDASTGAVTAWNPTELGYGSVYALGALGSTLYVGGSFTSTTHPELAAFDTTTGALTTWGAGGSGQVQALVVSGSTVYVGGQFTQLGTVARLNLGALDATTGQVLPWDPNVNDRVSALALSGSTIYAGGQFTTIGTDTRKYLAAIGTADGKATPWDPAPDSFVEAVAAAGGTIYAAGTFSTIAGQPRKYLAALSADTGAATSWNPDPSTLVDALAVSGSSVFAGGAFVTIGGQSRLNLAELDASTGQATSWAPNPNGFVTGVMADAEGTVYVGGFFTTLDQAAQGGLATFSVAPANAAAPTVAPAHVGKPATCTPGTWTGSLPQRYAYAWLLDGSPVSGQTGATFTPTRSAAGKQLACTVTATNRRGSVSATSAPVRIPPKPKAVTQRAKRVGSRKARLRGVVNPNGEKTTYYFQYGTTKRYGRRTRARTAGAGTRGRAVVVPIKRLKRGKTYHFRLVATSASGTSPGRDLRFKTKR